MRRADQHHVPSTDDADELLRAFGCRVTAPRRAVVQVLLDEPGPLTASDLAERATAASSGIHAATVYRTIALLTEIGLASHVHAGHGPALVQLAGTDTVVAACVDCGAITPVPATAVRDLVAATRRASGFELEPGHFALEGRCKACQAALRRP